MGLKYLIILFGLMIVGMSLAAPKHTILSTARPYSGAYSVNQ